MPKDSAAETREPSPLDAEPEVRATKNGATKTKKRKVKEYEEDVAEGEAAAGEASAATEAKANASPFEDDSPLDADAEAALQMVEVDRVGPGEGPGWVGRLFNYGNGPQPVSYGRVGSFPRTRGIYERVTAQTGGGEYKFATKGKAPVFKVLPGPPLPLPSEQQAEQQAAAGVGAGAYGAGSFAGQDVGQDDPFGPDYNPQEGIDPAQVQQSELNGWFRGGPYNRLLFYVNGVPSRPPRGSKPPASLLGGPAAMHGYDPAAYDHSGDDRVSKLEKLVERLVEKIDQNPRAEEERIRWEREMEARREERDRERERREEERERQREEREAERERQREERERDREARLEAAKLAQEAAKAQAEAAKEAAKLQAEAMKINATSSVDAAKEMAKAQADHSKEMVKILMARTDEGSAFDKALDRALRLADLRGGDERTEAERALGMAKDLIPTFTQGVGDVINIYRGGPGPGNGNGAPGGMTLDEQQKLIPVLGTVLKMCHEQTPVERVPFALAVACETAGVDYKKVKDALLAGGPDLFASWLDRMAAKVTSEERKAQIADAKELVLSEQGRAWITAMQAELRAAGRKQVTAQAQPSPTPPAVGG